MFKLTPPPFFLNNPYAGFCTHHVYNSFSLLFSALWLILLVNSNNLFEKYFQNIWIQIFFTNWWWKVKKAWLIAAQVKDKFLIHINVEVYKEMILLGMWNFTMHSWHGVWKVEKKCQLLPCWVQVAKNTKEKLLLQ